MFPVDGPIVNRRGLLAGTASAAALASLAVAAQPAAAPPPADPRRAAQVSLRVNGTHHSLALDNRTTLLDALRKHRLSGH